MKTRFSPSPTGLMHVGNLRTALFSFLLSKPLSGSGGEFLLRIEDTDKVRSTEEYTDQLLRDMRWMGLKWQEGPEAQGASGPYFQSQRNGLYESYYQQLIEAGQAYWCFCTETELMVTRKQQLAAGHPPRYPGTCRHLTADQIEQKRAKGLEPALRFKIPENDNIQFEDFVQGTKVFKAQDIGDFIIKKNDGSASFMFCNAIDDALMGVTHVMRGDDHITNTPRQLLVLQALKLSPPRYGHMALILGEDGKPLSKRNGSQSVMQLRETGYFPIAIANYLARLGHHFPEETLYDLKTLSEHFEVAHISKSPSRFDVHQLNHWQKEAVMSQAQEALWDWMAPCVKTLVPNDKTDLFVETIYENCIVLQDAIDWANALFIDKPELQSPLVQEVGADYFAQALKAIETHGLEAKAIFNHIKSELGVSGKKLFMPMRLAVSGVGHGPQIQKLFDLLGQALVIEKLKYAQATLKG